VIGCASQRCLRKVRRQTPSDFAEMRGIIEQPLIEADLRHLAVDRNENVLFKRA
jgi:hypothetical protein